MRFAIFNLPEELTPQWDKQPLGNQVVTTVASFLESGNTWQCMCYCHLHDSSAYIISVDVPGLTVGPGTLSVIWRVDDILVIFGF